MVNSGTRVLNLLSDRGVTTPGNVFNETGTAEPPRGSVRAASNQIKRWGRQDLAAEFAPECTKLPAEFTKIANKLNSIQFKFDPNEIQPAVDALQKAINSADDSNFDNLRSQFLISENSEPLPIEETQTLVDALRKIKTGGEFDSFNVDSLVRAHKTVFEDGGDQALSNGQAFVQRIADIARERQLVALNMQRLVTNFKALDAFLKALKDI